MLPIMTYIILRSAKADLVSECALMEEFIQEGYRGFVSCEVGGGALCLVRWEEGLCVL